MVSPRDAYDAVLAPPRDGSIFPVFRIFRVPAAILAEDVVVSPLMEPVDEAVTAFGS
jgi:hypothetical protein